MVVGGVPGIISVKLGLNLTSTLSIKTVCASKFSCNNLNDIFSEPGMLSEHTNLHGIAGVTMLCSQELSL